LDDPPKDLYSTTKSLLKISKMDKIREIVYCISPVNILDIAIITCLIYFILAWLKGTRAFRILVTLLGIGLFYFVASQVGLVLTSVLFQYLWAAIILVLVIVFQPEVRELLDRASPVRYLSGKAATDDPTIIGEIVTAVAELAGKRTGALIVFQRDHRLDNLLVKGRELDSLVSAEALIMIFQKNSPLHDGAVLVYRDRIKAAGCILPLTKQDDLNLRYGTRHRAALGLTERSDAVCAVISEERGEVSLIHKKQITVFRKRADFKDALERFLLPAIKQPEKAPRTIFNLIGTNWRLKSLSLCTAAFLWFAVVGPQRSELGITVPIQYANLPQTMEITGKTMDTIDVRLRGSEAGLAGLKPGSVRAIIELSGVAPGLNYFRITEKNLQVPPGITISQVRPSSLSLSVEVAAPKKTGAAQN
jgi:diadenylate cyclase